MPRIMAERPVPRATYRLQLNKDFGFSAVEDLAPYLGQLGVSHAYLSPILKARRGSMHGYDTVDHSIVNAELGTLDDFRRMAAALRSRGIGIVVDIVPNHMGIGGDENRLWLDVLEQGRKSRYAGWFDINWNPSEPSLRNKVLVPFLGRSFGEALEGGGLELRFETATGEFAIWAEGSHKLPLAPETYKLVLRTADGFGDFYGEAPDREAVKKRLCELCAHESESAARIASAVSRLNGPEGRNDLEAIIAEQHWRPARYSVAADDINYRRFFIVSDLAAIRVEQDEVFDHVHALTFQLVEEGLVDGLRIDHVDGLYDPKAYCLRLRQMCPRPIYLVVEKILAPHEALRSEWDVDGTTGYEFASAVTQLLTDRSGEADLTRAYEAFTGRTASFDEIERNAKLDIIDYEMPAELDAIALRLRAIAMSSRRTADLTRNAIRSCLRHIVASLPVYRTYVDEHGLTDQDSRNIAVAIAAARKAAPAVEPSVFDFLNEIMTGELCRRRKEYPAEAVMDAARRIQQYTGPVMAKGLEDTALYRYNRLIALSDVGEKPDRFGESIAAFHDFNAARLTSFPHGMLTTSSHDSKRGEDARARIAVLSGRPREWALAVGEWTAQLKELGAPELEPNDEWYLFQLLLGAWPTEFPETGPLDPAALETFGKRLDAAMLKSVREARTRTNWAVPKTEYEERVSRFVALALSGSSENAFLASFRELERRLATAGAHNGIVELVLKLTVPGVPDIYQGAEFWEQSMVDPDNRRPVDFRIRAGAIQEREPIGSLVASWRDGRLKQRLAGELLALRTRVPKLFSRGTYTPLAVGASEPVCAFLREWEGTAMVVAARLDPWEPKPWTPPVIELPSNAADRQWTSVLSDCSGPARLDAIMFDAQLPVAVLLGTR
jgi:(1->4)-alpha-D-glucan 1-alpha-D-glucosylmutase